MKRLSILIMAVFLISIFLPVFNSEADESPLTVGIGPYYSKEKIVSGFSPLVSYLADRIKRPVELLVTDTYEDLEDGVQSGKIDIGILGSGAYVKLRTRYPELKYLINTQTTKGGKTRAYYFAYFISHKKSGFTKMKHLRGKTFAFVSEKSSSGYKYPMVYFNKRKQLPEEYFSEVIFTGSHEAVTDMIAGRKIDSGVTWDVNLWTAEEKHGRIFTRLKKIGPMVTPVVVAHHKLDHALSEEIINILQNVPRSVFNRDLAFTGFVILPDKDFNTVREAVLN